jgi:hypothetical protein
MCPFCLTTMGLLAAGAACTGGLAALAVKLCSKKNGAGELAPNSNRGRNQDGDEQDREAQNRVAR